MSTITAANSTYAMAITNLFPVAQTLKGFMADAMFATEELVLSEVVMGADGRQSAGFVFNSVKQTVSIMPDSPSFKMFSLWGTTMQAATDVYIANGTLIMPSISKKFTMKNGVLLSMKVMPDAKKMLQGIEYKISWERVTAEDYNG